MFAETFTTLSLFLSRLAGSHLYTLLFLTFFGGVAVRCMIYYVLKAEERFCKEFETRVHRHLDREYPETVGVGFHALAEHLLRRTYHEIYDLRATHLRRSMDRALTLLDRLFRVEAGAARLIEDSLRQTRYHEQGKARPEFESLARFVFNSNPSFNRLAGSMPIATLNDALNLLPGLFIVGGLLGTFLGIMGALPELRGMDIANLQAARATLDVFLGQMAFSLNVSVLGIILSATFTLLNAFLSPATAFMNSVDKYKQSLEFLWNDACAHHAALPADPKTADLDKHPEIRQREQAPARSPDAIKAELPPPLPIPEEHVSHAQSLDPAQASVTGAIPDTVHEAIAIVKRTKEEDTALLEEQLQAGEQVSFDPAHHEPPPYEADTGHFQAPPLPPREEGPLTPAQNIDYDPEDLEQDSRSKPGSGSGSEAA